ncbi:unnamed protein product [Caenorhabditis nigoni]
MASTIENWTKMAEDLSIDPVYETNWCDMPEEIKLTCIGKMEFKERLTLRCTSKAERSLVDSQKIKFQSGIFNVQGFQLDFFARGYIFRWFKNPDEAVELTNYIFKIGIFEFVTFDYRKEEYMNFKEQISAKTIYFDFWENKTGVDALRKMKKGVESIRINAVGEIKDYALDDILAISQVQNVPYWHIKDCIQVECLHKVAQMWINRNVKIGSTFQLSSKSVFDFLGTFLERFTDQIVSQSLKRVRIRTNNADRHILLERGLDDIVGDDEHSTQFFRLMVIYAEMDESEYDDNCKEWICKIDSDIYAEENLVIDQEQNDIGNENDDHVENPEHNSEDMDDEDW